MKKFDNKVVIITGGTSGIGEATAELLAEEGANVIVVGRDADRGHSVQAKLNTIGKNCHFFKADVSNKDDIKRLRNYVDGKFGRLDALFNNAGVLITGTLEELTDEQWDKSYEVNVKAVMRICRSFMDLLVDSNGVVLNNASVNGLNMYIQGRASYMYASSKAALIQFSKLIAKNYAPKIRCNILCPGIVDTDIYTNKDYTRFKDVNLLGRIADPIEIAKVAVFLLSNDSSYMTGSTIIVDGGGSLK